MHRYASRGGTVDRIVDDTREAILSGRFALGQRLVEADLARELRVSRGPVREALGRLHGEGLVDLVPNRGALVRRLSRKEVTDRYQLRIAVEGLAAELCARHLGQADHRDRFLATLEPTRDEASLNGFATFRAQNQRFHRTVAELSLNPQLAALVEQMWLPHATVEVRDSLGLTSWSDSEAEHGRVADAILARDTAAASEAMQDHLRRGCARILAAPEQAFGR